MPAIAVIVAYCRFNEPDGIRLLIDRHFGSVMESEGEQVPPWPSSIGQTRTIDAIDGTPMTSTIVDEILRPQAVALEKLCERQNIRLPAGCDLPGLIADAKKLSDGWLANETQSFSVPLLAIFHGRASAQPTFEYTRRQSTTGSILDEDMSRKYQLAQCNIARMKAPLDAPMMSGFVSRLGEINALADGSPGFVWRLQDEDGDATSIQAFDDRMILVNMSVWESPRHLREFV